MKTPPKLVEALSALLDDDRFKNADTNEIDIAKITYLDAIGKFKATGIQETDIFTDVRDLVIAEIGFGIAQRLLDGGPAKVENTLRYEGLAALLGLWRAVVACQADLDEEQRRNRERMREGAHQEREDDVDGPEEDQGVA